MSDHLFWRGKKIVNLAVADSNKQQELNYDSVLRAKRDLFESDTEDFECNVRGDAEVNQNQLTFCNNEIENMSNVKEIVTDNVCSTNSIPIEAEIEVPSTLEGSGSMKNIVEIVTDNVCSTDNIPMEAEVEIPSTLEDSGNMENIVEIVVDNVCNIDSIPLEAEVEVPSTLEGSGNMENIVILKHNKTKLVDYPMETDDEISDFSAASDDDPCYRPPSGTEDKISDLSDFEIEEEYVKNLKRRRQKNIEDWKVNKTKIQRAKCLAYKNKKKECEAKGPKPVDCSKCRFQCTLYFTEEDRKAICKRYWGFANYERQKDFIIKNVVVISPKRRRKETLSESRRTLSKEYYLENASGKHRVCANFFEKTLNISNGPINTAIKGTDSTGCFSRPDKRGRKVPGNKTSEADVALVKEHIESFPTVESHYVRKYSQKLYLESGLSILKMYELYKTFCLERNARPVKQCTYRRIFCNDYNYSFFKPKKDLCATCSKYKEASSEKRKEIETDYTLHLIRKTECQEAKAKDKIKASEDPTFVTGTFDLQSVLQLPYSDVSLFYYSRKICVYNLTIYLASGEAHCYTWNELNGKRGSNEIGSILFIFFQSLPATVTSISLFCDTCGGQNRNQQVAAMLLYAVREIAHLNEIELKFLESGHSQMECDSMHSAIESAKKYKSAYTMTDWVNIFQSARSQRGKNKTNEQYVVHLLKYTDFFDLQSLAASTIKNRNKDEEGNTISWLKIKSLKVEKGSPGILYCRYDHSSDYKKVNVVGRGRRRTTPLLLSPAYSSLLPISKAKKDDLVKLVNAGHIPEELHPWYKSLPTSEHIRPERLPDSDENE